MSLQFRGRKTTTRPTQHEVRQLVVEIWRAWDSHHQRTRERHRADLVHVASSLQQTSGRPQLLQGAAAVADGEGEDTKENTKENTKDDKMEDKMEDKKGRSVEETMIKDEIDDDTLFVIRVPDVERIEGEDYYDTKKRAQRTEFNRWLLGFFRLCATSSTSTSTSSTNSTRSTSNEPTNWIRRQRTWW